MSSLIQDLDLTSAAVRLLGIFLAAYSALKYIEAKRSPVRTFQLFSHISLLIPPLFKVECYPHSWPLRYSNLLYYGNSVDTERWGANPRRLRSRESILPLLV